MAREWHDLRSGIGCCSTCEDIGIDRDLNRWQTGRTAINLRLKGVISDAIPDASPNPGIQAIAVACNVLQITSERHAVPNVYPKICSRFLVSASSSRIVCRSRPVIGYRKPLRNSVQPAPASLHAGHAGWHRRGCFRSHGTANRWRHTRARFLQK
jgi:hypothetical protein